MRRDWMGIIQQNDDGSERLNYDDESFPAYLFQGYLFPGCSWSRVAHYHEEIEIVTCTRHTVGHNVNGKNYVLNEGETIIVNANQIHFSYPTEPGNGYYNIAIIHPNLLCGSFAIADTFVKPIITNKSLPCIIFRNGQYATKQMYEASYRLAATKGDNLAINAEFFNVWRIIVEFCREKHDFEEEAADDPAVICIRKMLNFIYANYTRQVSLDEIASSGGVSRTYCNQLFHKYTNRSPMDSLMRHRCEKVSEHLTHSSMTMNEIADKTGFTGASYMAEIFKRYYGMSPRDYRKARMAFNAGEEKAVMPQPKE